ncbi:hypothetical protein CAP48_07070 [Advenella sp. S44]|uniref:ABC transporter permease n=1 Tax=Advenella sp. S44 TaxID=1982755 RepID=UPI000C2969A2|nr:ABC transporter permease [Advenella sp. S44]PJX25790.1 hypothetical protein CAP48_07070 [Advenella sp. S44]
MTSQQPSLPPVECSFQAEAYISKFNRLLLTGTAIGVLFFLLLPVFIVIPMSFSESSSLQFPPQGFSLRWYAQVFSDAGWLAAIKTSSILAILSSTLALVLGSLGAYGLTRGTFKGRDLLQSNFIAPLIIPSVVLAVALYMALSATGLLGSFFGLLLAHTLLGIPYVVLIMSVAIRSFDERIEQVAFTLGASWTAMFTRILLPNLMPSAAAAWIFAFVTSFDEVVITNFVAGTHETIPKRMFNELILQVNPGITAIATVLICVSLVLMAIAAKLNHRPRVDSSH